MAAQAESWMARADGPPWPAGQSAEIEWWCAELRRAAWWCRNTRQERHRQAVARLAATLHQALAAVPCDQAAPLLRVLVESLSDRWGTAV
jgi:hypothetical protein